MTGRAEVLRRPGMPPGELWVLTGAAAYVVALALATQYWTYDLWGGLVIGPALLVLTLPLLRRVAERDGPRSIHSLLVAALVVKLAMAVPRWAVAFLLYEGTADASSYNDSARLLAPLYRDFVFPFSDQPGGFGTKVVSSITGGVYAVTGPSLMVGFLVFSWLGFLGLLFAYRAIRTALPDVKPTRYAGLLFFLPSMAFWPSSIGKEAVIMLAIGLVLLGAARNFTRQRLGLPFIAAGLLLAFLIRPHIAGLLAGSFAIGYILRPARVRTPLTPIVKAAGVMVIGAAGLFVIAKAASSLGVSDTSSALQTLNQRGGLTVQGGSAFEATPLRAPQDIVPATLAVLFRPFPWEAESPQVLIASAEGMGLLALAVLGWRRIVAGLGRLREPFVVMSAVYLLGFIFLFSEFGNFGILARQRVQAYPVLLVFLCMAPLAKRKRNRSISTRPGSTLELQP